jgi:hypothetical protein
MELDVPGAEFPCVVIAVGKGREMYSAYVHWKNIDKRTIITEIRPPADVMTDNGWKRITLRSFRGKNIRWAKVTRAMDHIPDLS